MPRRWTWSSISESVVTTSASPLCSSVLFTDGFTGVTPITLMSSEVSFLSAWVSTLQLRSSTQRWPSSSTQAKAWLSVISIMTVPGSCVAISTLST